MGCSISKQIKIQNKIPETFKPHKCSTAQDLSIKPSHFILQNEYDFTQIYRLGNVIGHGIVGEVRICYLRGSNEKRAVKIFKKDLSQSRHDDIIKEITILKSLDHPNIVRIFEYFESLSRVHLVMEYCAGGELISDIIKSQCFSEYKAMRVIHQLLLAVAYMHENKIVHRDIKPENVLLEDQSEFAEIKLVDFGSATDIYEDMEEPLGTTFYMAPEVLNGCYSELCDVWSVGVILYLLFTGSPPFMGKEQEVIAKIKEYDIDYSSEIWNSISIQGKFFIQHLLCPEATRLSAKSALCHEWFNPLSHKSTPRNFGSVLHKLSAFHYSSKLKQAVSTYLVTQCIPDKELKELKEIFSMLDKDCDGKLSKEEIMEYYMQDMGFEEAEVLVDRIIDNVDSDKNGFVDYFEFLAATVDQSKLLSLQNLQRAYELFDKDGNGMISAEEMREVLRSGWEGGSESENKVWEEITTIVNHEAQEGINLEEFIRILQIT